MKKYLIIALAALALVSTACDSDRLDSDSVEVVGTRHYLLTFINDSDETVSWFVPEHGNDEDDSIKGALPDTLTSYLKDNFYEVAAHRKSEFYIVDSANKCPLEGYHPDEIVDFYVFSAKTLSSNSWKAIVSRKMWLAKYSYSVQDMIDAGKVIRYTGK